MLLKDSRMICCCTVFSCKDYYNIVFCELINWNGNNCSDCNFSLNAVTNYMKYMSRLVSVAIVYRYLYLYISFAFCVHSQSVSKYILA